MTAQACVFIATSLDGYIARADGGIDWLEAANARVPPGEDCGYAAFMQSVDVLVMGRHSFEVVLGFGHWPYGDKPVVVLSSRPLALPTRVPSTVGVSSETPAALLTRLSAQGARRVYVDGGLTIQRFLADGLIAEMTITRIPVLLGAGRPLFGPADRDVTLEHLGTRSWDFGFVQSKYRVASHG